MNVANLERQLGNTVRGARRFSRRARASQHLHSGLRAKHPLLIGSQDQRLLAG
jgi:hypothetical protein